MERGEHGMRLLFAEDDPDLSRAVRALLEHSGYTVECVSDGLMAMNLVSGEGYDGMILDWMMPGASGIEVLRHMRSSGIHVPVLMLTARDAVEDRVSGLDAGADDYLPKPFSSSELLARVRALVRRRGTIVPSVLHFGDLELDAAGMELRCPGGKTTLTGKAFQLMQMLMQHPRVILSVQQMMDYVWGWDTDAEIHVVWVNISNLRKKLAEIGSKCEIRAVRGSGYFLEEGHG